VTEIWLRLTQRCNDERGASLVEYALLLSLIAVVCITAVTFFGQATSNSYSSSASTLFMGAN
jgi:Flp pilus assembly pilin Flp